MEKRDWTIIRILLVPSSKIVFHNSFVRILSDFITEIKDDFSFIPTIQICKQSFTIKMILAMIMMMIELAIIMTMSV